MSGPGSFEFGAPAFFTTGAVGRPGQRTFYVQAGQEGQVATLRIEKEQVRALADHLDALLTRVSSPRAVEPGGEERDLSLREPLAPAWTVGTIGVAYEEEPDRVVIVLEELQEETGEEEPEEPPGAAATLEPPEEAPGPSTGPEPRAGATGRVRLTRGQVRGFVDRARAVLRAGRKPCQVCGRPMDPDGHVCPRANGKMHLGRPR